MKTPDRYTKFRKKAPQKVGTYTFVMSMWEPSQGLTLGQLEIYKAKAFVWSQVSILNCL